MSPGMCDHKASRLVVIEDEALILEWLKDLFAGAGHRVKGFGCAEDFLAELEWIAPVDCIIADVCLPGMNGLDLLSMANPQLRCVPIVIMSGRGDIAMAVSAIKNGAFDFVEKPFEPARIEEIVDAALAPGRRRCAAARAVQEAETALSRLTPRQSEIVDLIAQGMTSKEIALRLGMSFRTVDTHRARIMDKLQVESLAELLRLRLAAEMNGG